MAKTNTFSGVKLKYRTVEHYKKNKEFDHFVFQQALSADGPADGNNFTLVAYARTKYLNVLNGGKPVECEEVKSVDFAGTKPDVQFGNMKLNTVLLDILYPPGITSDLTVYATGYWDNGPYVRYTASTIGRNDAPIRVRIDPSPPA